MATPNPDDPDPLSMATPKSTPTSKHTNRGNRRSGPVRGTKSGLRRGTLDWHKDSLILERVKLTRELMARAWTADQILPAVNALMAKHGQPEITLDTVYEDRKRVKEQMAGEIKSDARDHVDRYERVIREAWRAFDVAKDQSLNRSAYLGVIRASLKDLATLDGSFVEKTEHDINLNLLDLIKGIADGLPD